MKIILSTIFSVGMSSIVLFGQHPWHQFVVYMIVIFTAISWIAIFTVGINKIVTNDIRKNILLSIPCGAYSLFALVTTGHQVVAAFSCCLSLLLLLAAFNQEQKENRA